MLKEAFIGKPPSHFQINPIVKAFIISEMFLWSSWNAVTPIFAVFATTQITGGSVEVAASSFSIYLIVRVIFELISGRFLAQISQTQKFIVSMIGISFISLGYFGFVFTKTVTPIYIFYAIVGLGLGIASPAKNSLFSTHMDKNKETTEWGLYDGVIFMGMAMSATIGGFVAKSYGFPFLFSVVAVTNLLSIIPYILYISSERKK